jgi:hypothetical protein
MAFIYGDRVKETSLSVGTGPMVLGGATAGFVSFAAGVGLGNECFYGIVNTIDDTWEMGRGTVAAGSITRDTILSSSNSNNIVSFAVGDKIVYTTVPKVFFDGALDSTSHGLEDHTVGPLNLLDVGAHNSVDHTAAPLNLLTAASHQAVDHTVAPFNLMDTTAHGLVDHTVAPFSLLDSTSHGLEDHKIGPLFLLDTAAHNALDHNVVTNNNPGQVSSAERIAGTQTSLRSYSPLDVATMAGLHGGGGSIGATTHNTETLLINIKIDGPGAAVSPYDVFANHVDGAMKFADGTLVTLTSQCRFYMAQASLADQVELGEREMAQLTNAGSLRWSYIGSTGDAYLGIMVIAKQAPWQNPAPATIGDPAV